MLLYYQKQITWCIHQNKQDMRCIVTLKLRGYALEMLKQHRIDVRLEEHFQNVEKLIKEIMKMEEDSNNRCY